MEHYKYDLANNIIALAGNRARQDPKQTDDQLFHTHFVNNLAPDFKKQYGVKLKYGKYAKIAAQAKKVLSQVVGN